LASLNNIVLVSLSWSWHKVLEAERGARDQALNGLCCRPSAVCFEVWIGQQSRCRQMAGEAGRNNQGMVLAPDGQRA